jgi:hypothetical protein
MEITLECLQGDVWKVEDPGLVFAQDDRVRFRFHTNFDGYLYVMNQATSGDYQTLFPREDTGQQNRIEAGKEYVVPATQGWFRVAGRPATTSCTGWSRRYRWVRSRNISRCRRRRSPAPRRRA